MPYKPFNALILLGFLTALPASADEFTGQYSARDSFVARMTGKITSKGDLLAKEGMAARARGDYETALLKWDDAIHRYQSGDKGLNLFFIGGWQFINALKSEKAKIPGLLNLSGYVYMDLNAFEKASASFREASRLAKEHKLPREECLALLGMAAVAQKLGDTGIALTHLDEAMAKATEHKDLNMMALSRIGQADLFLRRRSGPEAFARYEAALTLAEQAKVPSGIQSALRGMGLSLSLQGHHGEARLIYLRALDLARERKDMPEILDSLNNLGACDMALGADVQARSSFQEAMSLITAMDLSLPDLRSTAAHRLGSLAAKEGDLLRAARSFKQAIDDIEETRSQLQRGANRVGFFEDKQAVFDDLIDLLIRLSPDQYALLGPQWDRYGTTPVEAAFTMAESTRARSFLDSLSSRQDASRGRLPKEVAEEEKTLLRALDSLQSGSNTGLAPGGASLREALAKARRDLASFIDRLRKDYPGYAAIAYPGPVAPSQVPLRPREVLVAFKVNPAATYVWVLRKDKETKVFTIPQGRTALSAQVHAFREPMESMDRLGAFDPRKGEALYHLLLEGPLKDLGAEERPILVPDGPLNLLPFEALTTGAPAQGGPAWLGDLHRFTYYPSASTLAMVRRAPGAKAFLHPLMALGDPVYDEKDPRYQASLGGVKASPAEARPENLPQLRSLLAASGFSIPRLPETREEVLGIGKLYEYREGTPHLKLGLEASKASLLAADLSQYQYLHFATHGILNGDVPFIQEPSLVLTQVGQAKPEDGFLRMGDVLQLHLNADLVVLSACKTALGREVAGEGVEGLSRAFMLAGARSVIVSLWAVESNSTVTLMESFYTHLKAGSSREAALRLAKLDLQKGRFTLAPGRGLKIEDKGGSTSVPGTSPFFWAPFILLGEGEDAP